MGAKYRRVQVHLQPDLSQLCFLVICTDGQFLETGGEFHLAARSEPMMVFSTMATRSSQDVRWVDLVLESYVIRSRLLRLLMDRARRERLNVSEADFNIQARELSNQRIPLVLIESTVLRR